MPLPKHACNSKPKDEKIEKCLLSWVLKKACLWQLEGQITYSHHEQNFIDKTRLIYLSYHDSDWVRPYKWKRRENGNQPHWVPWATVPVPVTSTLSDDFCKQAEAQRSALRSKWVAPKIHFGLFRFFCPVTVQNSPFFDRVSSVRKFSVTLIRW